MVESLGMPQRYSSRRQNSKLIRRSRRNFVITIFLVGFLLYAALAWVLPFFINGIGFVKSSISPSKKPATESPRDSSLAPPVLSIPFEATNTAQINIKGYGTSNSKVALFMDDDKKDVVDVESDGTFEFKNVLLVLGTNNVYCKSVDEKNQESKSSKTIKIIYDNEKPILKINEPEDGKKIQGGDKKIKISGNTEAGAQVFINDSQAIVDNAGNFSVDQSLNEGDNNFNIKSVDKANNAAEVSRKVTYQP